MRRWIAGGVALVVLLPAGWLLAQIYGNRYAAFHLPAIRSIEARAEESGLEPGGIVFTGSSSIRRWKTLARDMAPLPVVNHGFGGSQISHVVHYAPRIVLPQRPRVVVLYAGANDLSAGQSPASVADDFRELVSTIHAELPETRILFLSMKPSILRRERWPQMERANRSIREMCEADPRLVYVDVATAMLDREGEPREELFVWDGLHLNEKGYALWTSILRPRLELEWRRLQRGS